MKKVTQVNVGRIWTPFSNGQYHICFTPERNYRQFRIQLNIGSDEGSGDIATIQSACMNGKELKTFYGNIVIGDVKKGEPVDVILELENHERSGLEVLTYAEQ